MVTDPDHGYVIFPIALRDFVRFMQWTFDVGAHDLCSGPITFVIKPDDYPKAA